MLCNMRAQTAKSKRIQELDSASFWTHAPKSSFQIAGVMLLIPQTEDANQFAFYWPTLGSIRE